MRCPHDETVLQMSERHGIEIDYCPNCRGVWLDRGELDKIIDQAAAATSARPAPPAQPTAPPPPAYAAPPQGTVYPPHGGYRGSPGSPDSPNYHDPRYQQGYGDPRHRQGRRRDSFLGNLFDF